MKQAVILAAGEGQRLRPFTANKPKAMIFIAGKPILQYVVEALAQNGIRSIVLVVGYRREQIFNYMGSGERFGVDITYVTQEKRLGTAHALAQAERAVEDEFLVLSGDKLIEAGTIARFVTVKPEAVLVKKVEDPNPERYGVLTVGDGMVRNISEMEQLGEVASNIVSTRIYALSREMFSFLKPELMISNALNSMVAQGKAIIAYETEAAWLDVVYPWDILSLNGLVLREIKANLAGTIERGVYFKGQVSVGKDTVIRSNSSVIGPAVIGDGCDIGPNACILPATSIGDNTRVAPFSEVSNSVVGSDVDIGSGSTIQDSVIDKGCLIKGHFTACSGEAEVQLDGEHHSAVVGAMLGEGCSIGSGVVAQPGVIVGNYSEVRAQKLISGRLPDKSLVF